MFDQPTSYSLKSEQNDTSRAHHGPEGLCELCELVEFDDIFQEHGHYYSHTSRSVSHILAHQNCAFCWLIRRAIPKPDLWHSPPEKWIITLGNFAGHLGFNVFEFKKPLQNCLRKLPSCVIGFDIMDTADRPDHYLSTVAPYRVQLLAPEHSHHKGRTKTSTYWRYYNYVGLDSSFSSQDQMVLDSLPDSIFCARPIEPLVDYELLKGATIYMLKNADQFRCLRKTVQDSGSDLSMYSESALLMRPPRVNISI